MFSQLDHFTSQHLLECDISYTDFDSVVVEEVSLAEETHEGTLCHHFERKVDVGVIDRVLLGPYYGWNMIERLIALIIGLRFVSFGISGLSDGLLMWFHILVGDPPLTRSLFDDIGVL